MLRDGVTGDWIGTFEGHTGAVWSACISDDTILAATGSADQTASVWDARTGDQLQHFPQKHVCKTVAFPRDASQLLTGGLFDTVNLYDVQRPEQILLQLDTGPVKFARFVEREKDTILTGSANGKISHWDARSGKLIRSVDCMHELKSAELQRQSPVLSVVVADNSVHFYDSRNLELIKKYSVPDGTESASLQPSEERFVICGRDLQIRVMSYATGEELECLRGHHGPVMVIRFSPTGDTYASGADDGTIRIWQTYPKANNVPKYNS
mmetsp:Transcript_6976/g.21231  ORF Transcript_6976/g.21231 Transcript_6976/m.21231 type:complete len:267 (-) Transcript_6976:623-1423(-)